MTKAKTCVNILKILGCSFLFILFTFCYCDKNKDLIKELVQYYGYDYHIVEPESNVYLESDTLFAFVGYSGCKFPHEFEFNYSVINGNSRVWFKKITPDEPCDAHFQEWLKYKLPPHAFGRLSMVFLGPRGVSIQIY